MDTTALNLYNKKHLFEQLTLWKFTYRGFEHFIGLAVNKTDDEPLDAPPQMEKEGEFWVTHALVGGSVENAMIVSRLIVNEITSKGEAPFGMELIGIEKIQTCPAFSATAISRYQEAQLETAFDAFEAETGTRDSTLTKGVRAALKKKDLIPDWA